MTEPAQAAQAPWRDPGRSIFDARMVDLVRRLATYPRTRADEMSAEDMRVMCRDAVAIYDALPLTVPVMPRVPAALVKHPHGLGSQQYVDGWNACRDAMLSYVKERNPS